MQAKHTSPKREPARSTQEPTTCAKVSSMEQLSKPTATGIGITGRYWGASWPLIVGALIYLVFLVHGNYLLGDADTYWHLAAGRWILEHGAIPVSDPFSHSMRGAPWTAHEWLSEVIFAAAYATGGWTGLIALTALAFAGALAILTRFLLKEMEPVHALMFVAFAVMLPLTHLVARPHVIAMPLMVLWTAHLVRASEHGHAPSLWLLPVMTLWANLHGSFTLGLGLTLFFLVEGVLNARLQNKTMTAAKSWLAFAGLAFLSALATPHGLKGILFTLHIFGGSYALDQIAEWRSPNFHFFQPLEVWLFVGLAAVLFQGLRLPLMRIALLLGFLHLGLTHNRNIELLGLLTPLFLAAPLAGQWRERQATGRQLATMDHFFQALAHRASKGATVLVVSGLVAVTVLATQLGELQPDKGITPTDAIQAARKANLTGPVLNEYSFGGYLIYSGISPFIDGRADMYGDDFLKQYIEAMSLEAPDGLLLVLKKYHIQWTLLPPNMPAVALLDHLPEWRRLYADKIAVVHVKKSPSPQLP